MDPEMWKSVIWSDKCRFKLFHSDGRIRVWHQINERFLNQCIKKTVKWEGGSVMVWGCFFANTLGPCYPIVNTMNSVSYIENVLEPFYSTFYLDLLNKQPDILFQQDNAPPHVSGKKVKKKKCEISTVASSESGHEPHRKRMGRYSEANTREDTFTVESRRAIISYIGRVGKNTRTNTQTFNRRNATKDRGSEARKRLSNQVLRLEITRLSYHELASQFQRN